MSVKVNSLGSPHVLLNQGAGGPREGREQLAGGQFADSVRAQLSLFREIKARFSASQDTGPSSYASQTLQIHPDADTAILREDAASAMAHFIEANDLAEERLGFSVGCGSSARSAFHLPRPDHVS